jgi:hypothetical protein
MNEYRIKLKDARTKTVNANSYKIENGFFIFESNNQMVFSVSTERVKDVEQIQTVNESTFNSSDMICD